VHDLVDVLEGVHEGLIRSEPDPQAERQTAPGAFIEPRRRVASRMTQPLGNTVLNLPALDIGTRPVAGRDVDPEQRLPDRGDDRDLARQPPRGEERNRSKRLYLMITDPDGLMRIDFLYWEDCPSHADALARLRQVLADEGIDDAVHLVRVETQEDAERHGFPGSPTIRFDGVDLQPEGVQGRALLTCRTYRTETGRLSPLPTVAMIRRVLHARRQTPKEVRDDAGHA
jgi:hypothetical protein